MPLDQSEAKKSVRWFTALISKPDKKKFDRDSFNPTDKDNPFIGGMFFYKYDAKWKKELPYWDALPLTIPFNILDDGFLGLNLHYVPVNARAVLLNKLIKYKKGSSNRKYMELSWKIITASVKAGWYEEAVHRYLTGHIRSKLIRVDHDDWKKAIHLPVARWQKGKPY